MRKIAFFIPALEGGGAERVVVNLVKQFVKLDFEIHLLLSFAKGSYLKEVPDNVRIFDFKSRHVLYSLPKLVRYLRDEKPYAIVSSLNHANLVVILAKLISKSRTKLLVREDSTPSKELKNNSSIKSKFLPLLMKALYPYADAVVAVSEGVKEDLVKFVKVPQEKVKVIYNPVINESIFEKAKEKVDHSWFCGERSPVIISVGRLTKAKGFETLIRAFSLVRNEIDARLVILGEGEERKSLENLGRELGISEYIWMPGFAENPYKYMSRSSVFVLSSIYEGFGNVLVEALALGLPVVSTDCKSGPREILENGKYGKLVPVGDAESLAKAIVETLRNPNSLRKPSKEVLQRYSVEYASKEYLKLLR
ncbi:MAG: glycosyltransferase [Nitrososphaeria archaeon]